MKRVRIITKEKVDRTFENEHCRVMRTIISSTKTLNNQEFVIQTDYCNYEDKVVPMLDSEGNRQYDPNGNLIVKVIQVLRILGKKDKLSHFIVDSVKSDQLFSAIRNKVALGNSYSDFIQQVEQQGLLLQTQMDNPWGYGPDKWKVLHDDDDIQE